MLCPRLRDLPTNHQAAVIDDNFRAGRVAITGFYDEQGNPAPWPGDLDDWRPSTDNPIRIDF